MKPLFLTAFSIFLLTVSYATSQPSLDSFIQCLQNHSDSDSSKPISASVYTRNNSSFSQILLTRIHNRRHSTPNTPKPLAIITATDESNVRATVICAKSHGIQLRIRSGGHDYEGMSYVSDVPFVILDMFNLNSINIDVANEIAWVDAGATTGQIYYRIAEKSTVHGFPAGAGLNLGAGGHFSGGGYGYMMRKYGLSVDNIIDARIVDVNGKILDRKTMGEDVFWAIRGGGGASFGVILSWKISLVKVPEKVTVFRINKTVEQGATDVVYQWQFVAPKLHEDLFIRVMPTVQNSTQQGKKTVQVDFIGHFLGLSDRLLGLLNGSFPELGLQKSDCHEVSWAESTVFWADYPVGTSIEVLLNKPKHGSSFYKGKSDYVKEPISKEAMESIWDLMIKYEKVWMQWNPYGGRMSEISSSATPFPHRDGNLFLIQYGTFWQEEGDVFINHYMNVSRTWYEAMAPYVSKTPRETFLNYRDLDIGANIPSNETDFTEGINYGSKLFKDNFKRLVNVKTMVDPGNFFRHEQSIPTRPSY